MNRHQSQRTVWTVFVATCVLTSIASAVPVTGVYQDDPAHCDNFGPLTLTHELGEQTVFPANESIVTSAAPSIDPRLFACEPDDGIANDWNVILTNTSGQAWQDVFFVVDGGVTVGNYDGAVSDVAMPGFNHAFRIDNVGSNIPLIFESVAANNILDVGETWEFLVTNYSVAAGPLFESAGKFSESSHLSFDPFSNASILANPVPEPSSVAFLGLGATALFARRRRAIRNADSGRTGRG